MTICEEENRGACLRFGTARFQLCQLGKRNERTSARKLGIRSVYHYIALFMDYLACIFSILAMNCTCNLIERFINYIRSFTSLAYLVYLHSTFPHPSHPLCTTHYNGYIINNHQLLCTKYSQTFLY